MAFTGCYALAYWIVELIWRRGSLTWGAFGWSVSVNFLSLLFFSGAAALSSKLIGGKRDNLFTTLADAMRRIARGDFDVSLPVGEHDKDNLMGQMVSGLNEMAESLKKMEAMRQEFVSDVSHEIQSPLTSIAGFARALKDEGLSATQRDHYLDIIESESRRLSRLSDSLLRLSALDSRTAAIDAKPCRLDAQLRSVVLMHEPQWVAKNLQVTVDLSEVSVVADESMLGQVWTNLVHNAVKFTPADGCIGISLTATGDQAVVRVSDSGLGIAPEDLPLVFDRFFKADTSRTSGTGGNGLGLSIAQRIITLHGGTIHAESAGLGKGSTFTVRLPLTPLPERRPGS